MDLGSLHIKACFTYVKSTAISTNTKCYWSIWRIKIDNYKLTS